MSLSCLGYAGLLLGGVGLLTGKTPLIIIGGLMTLVDFLLSIDWTFDTGKEVGDDINEKRKDYYKQLKDADDY